MNSIREWRPRKLRGTALRTDSGYHRGRGVAARTPQGGRSRSDSCTATNSPSFNELVGANQERLQDRQPERLGGLEIDHQREFGRLLDGKIGRFGTLQNPVDIGGGAPLKIECFRRDFANS